MQVKPLLNRVSARGISHISIGGVYTWGTATYHYIKTNGQYSVCLETGALVHHETHADVCNARPVQGAFHEEA